MKMWRITYKDTIGGIEKYDFVSAKTYAQALRKFKKLVPKKQNRGKAKI